MSPDEILLRRLAAEIDKELESLEQLSIEFRDAPAASDTYSLRARGSLLHDFYTGVERVFVRIAEELNGGVPRGDQWHRQLLQDMTIAIPDVRPSVVGRQLADELAEFLRFRHVFRNVYGFVLDHAKLKLLEERFPDLSVAFIEQLRVFSDWLRGAG